MGIKHLKNMINNPITYSSSNEVTAAEIKPLGINEYSKVLCITASGSRTLDLLTGNPQEIVSVDINPAQNRLLELKIAGFKNLEYKELLAFLGVVNCKDRLKIYQNSLRSSLSQECIEFWDKYPHFISRGVIFSGRLENFARLTLDPLLFFVKKDLAALFECNTVEEQRMLYEKKRKLPIFNIGLALASLRPVTKLFLRDPAFYAYTNENFPQFLDKRLNELATRHPARGNFFLSTVFKGCYIHKNALPTYLKEESYEIIRNNLHKIRIKTSCLNDYLKTCPENYYDAFSLSDFTCYVSQEYFEETLKEVLRTSKLSANLCYRNFFTDRQVPDFANGWSKRDTLSEEILKEADLTCMYNFTVLNINKQNTLQFIPKQQSNRKLVVAHY